VFFKLNCNLIFTELIKDDNKILKKNKQTSHHGYIDVSNYFPLVIHLFFLLQLSSKFIFFILNYNSH